MKSIRRFVVTLALVFAFLSNTLPCGPGYVSPLFDTSASPENPFAEFAAGKLGIIKPKFRRSVLYAAYRYIAGNGMTASEQRSMVEVWNAEINNKNFTDDSVDEAVKAWIDQRKKVELKEEKPPEVYSERSYGGYEFFPNCTKNAFEVATETLSDRIGSYGSADISVINWVAGQDAVFENCANGKRTPDEAAPGSPDWLLKDRAYQRAAAEFYSMDYEGAKEHFAEIALDSESPWQETADYLVARTLVRQASLSKAKEKADSYYDAAEAHLQRFISRSGKFADSAEHMTGLIAYRRHPKERTSELARKLSYSTGNDNFRQDVIDYTWLLDKFESEILTAEEKRREAQRQANTNTVGGIDGAANSVASAANTLSNAGNTASNTGRSAVKSERKNEDDLELTLYSVDYSQSWTFYVRVDATDDDAFAEAERVMGKPLNDETRSRVRTVRQAAYAGRFSADRNTGYDGGYWGEEKLSPSLLPEYLRRDDLTDWLFSYQMQGAEAFLYALDKYKQTHSDLWLMTAISKAEKSSAQLPFLLEAAANANHSSAAYTTIAFHRARVLLTTGKTAEARKVVDEMLDSGDALTIASRNSFMSLRLNMAQTLEDFLKYSLKKPFAFDFDGDVGTIDEFIAEQKSYFSPENDPNQTREKYEAEIDANFEIERKWQDRLMFDDDTVEVINQHFPTASLIDVMRSPALPEYMRDRFALAVWTRAYILNDAASLNKMTPELIKIHPEFEPSLARAAAARTPAAREAALLYFVLKTPLLSPYLESGMGKDNNDQDEWSSDDWWCAPYDTEYNAESESEVPKQLPTRPAFLTAAQTQAAQAERKKIAAAGDAPKFLGGKVLAWAKVSPTDRRVPEALYIAIQANGWTKYGCGNDEELKDTLVAFLKKHYPGNEWTAKLAETEND